MNKKIVFVILCVCATAVSRAQTYYPFIEEGKIWAQIVVTDGTVTQITTTQYRFQGDTLINGTTYHRAFECYHDPTVTNWGPLYQPSRFYREDNRKVWYLELPATERLMYNFDLQPGDSMPLYPDSAWNFWSHVTMVDSTEIAGSWRRTIHFDFPDDTWIEGLGSLNHIFYPVTYGMFTGGYYKLLCVSDMVQQLFQNPDYEGCYVDTLYSSAPTMAGPTHELKIYPNPCAGSFVVQSALQSEYSTLDLFSSDGRLVATVQVADNPSPVSAQYLQDGIYYLRLTGRYTAQWGKVIIRK